MRKGSFASAIIGLLLIVPVSAAQSEPEPLTFSIWPVELWVICDLKETLPTPLTAAWAAGCGWAGSGS